MSDTGDRFAGRSAYEVCRSDECRTGVRELPHLPNDDVATRQRMRDPGLLAPETHPQSGHAKAATAARAVVDHDPAFAGRHLNGHHDIRVGDHHELILR